MPESKWPWSFILGEICILALGILATLSDPHSHVRAADAQTESPAKSAE